MNDRSLLLPIYAAASAGIRPLVPAVLLWRRRRGKEDRHRVRERMGVAALPRPEGLLVWLHAASVGDGQALLPLVRRLGARGFHVLVSTRTLASANALNRQLPAGSFHQFMPIDVPHYVRRFLDHWRPDLVLLAGGELWPNVLLETSRRRLTVIFVNARLSDRAYAHCRRMRGFVGALMRRIDLCLTRSDLDTERFVEFGAKAVQTVGDLAFDVAVPSADPAAMSTFAARVGTRPIWMAALSDPADWSLVLEAHRRLLLRNATLVTVLVPRLPRDGVAIAKAASDMNLAVALRSREGRQPTLPNLYVADIGGEIGLFYRLGGIAFLGRTKEGAGCPIEAARLGCVVLHGAQVDGFASLYAALDKAHGGLMIKDATGLAGALERLLGDTALLQSMRRNAARTMDQLCGGTARVMRAIEPHVVQMLVEH